MPRRAKRDRAEQPSASESDVLRSLNHEEMNEEPSEVVTLGVGSRSPLTEKERERATLLRPRGLLPVPPEVEAEVDRQEAKHEMTPEYSKTLRDRLTLEYYFSDVEVAFRRTPEGIVVLAAGLDEIAEFRRTTTGEDRQGVVYGVG
jgi:hypothetical protein